jgi:PAS domain S-box-containing protein
MKRSLLPRRIVNRWKRWSVYQRGSFILAIPIVCFGVVLGAWVISRNATIEAHRNIDRKEMILSETNQILIQLLNADVSMRGYCMTRQPGFLSSYQQSVSTLPDLLDQLESMVNVPFQKQQVNDLNQLVDQTLEHMDRTLRTVEAQPQLVLHPDPELEQLLNQGKANLDQTQMAIANFVDYQQERLEMREDILKRWRLITILTIISAAVVGFTGSAAAFYLLKHLDQELKVRKWRLDQSETKMQAVVDNVVDGIITLDRNGTITTFNPAAVAMFGYEPDEVLGQSLDRLLAAPLYAETNGRKPIVIGNQHQVQLGRVQRAVGQRHDGTQFPIDVAISEMSSDNPLSDGSLAENPLSDDPVSDNLLIAIIRDITEQLRTEEALQYRANELARLSETLVQTNAILSDRNRELDQFAYVASHDLKAPLRAIANLSEWIEEDLDGCMTEETQHQMVLLRRRVQRMEGLINGLLQYARIGRVQAIAERVDVRELLQEVIDLVAPPAEFSIHMDAELPTFKAKRLLLRQVFANLISNAVKHHNRPDGNLHITVRDLGNSYEFSVQDDGPGIAPEHHERIFAIFQVLQSRDQQENTGIGLSIVKKIVEGEGGTIELESAAGQGATFRFTWLKVPAMAIA